MALYLMLSRTNTGMGKVIRRYTGAQYNHVSLTLDPELKCFVSFARFVEDVPLVGGYIQEPVERFLYLEGAVPVRIFRLDLPDEKEQALRAMFARAGKPDTGLMYDSLSALVSRWHIPGCYTCLSFASYVLGKPFRSLQELEKYLAPHQIFQGDLRELISDSGNRSDPYFRHRGLLRGSWDTVQHFCKLAARLTRMHNCKHITPD